MLPKLQQSSLAQSLRRDNPASHLQCIYCIIKVRINSKVSLENKLINAINLGRTITLPKILILALVISQRSTFQKRNSRMLIMNLLMNSPSRDLYRSTLVTTEMVAKHHQLFRKRHNFKNQSQNQEPSKKEMFLHLSSEGIMIEEIFQSELTIKTHFPN